MSRLDSFIRRMQAQRDLLDDLAPRVAGVPGLVLEIGFGNGRTYDHLRGLLPDRRILVFEAVVVPDLPYQPLPGDLVVGDARSTAAALPDGAAALIHADIGAGDPARDRSIHEWLPALIARLLAPGGFAASGTPLAHPLLAPHPLPAGVSPGRYCAVQRTEGVAATP